jgi:VIT1/CCC1 family predicted Fe2+/Mn2+ transporter
MVADERSPRGRPRPRGAGARRLSGTFRAAVFGANDGLVSNLALVLGIGRPGSRAVRAVQRHRGPSRRCSVDGRGEYVSVRSQRELLDATEPSDYADASFPHLDLDANELALVYRTRGMAEAEASARARPRGGARPKRHPRPVPIGIGGDHEVVGSARAAASSFLFFASGAIIPVLPWIFGLSGFAAVAVALVLVGVALGDGRDGGTALGRTAAAPRLRQLAIGFGAAAVTYVLGLLFGVSAG